MPTNLYVWLCGIVGNNANALLLYIDTHQSVSYVCVSVSVSVYTGVRLYIKYYHVCECVNEYLEELPIVVTL